MMGQRSRAGNPLPAPAALLSSAQPFAGLAIGEPISPDPEGFAAENANFSRTRTDPCPQIIVLAISLGQFPCAENSGINSAEKRPNMENFCRTAE
jgi:hypothetical protein